MTHTTGYGRRASIQANRLITSRSRCAVVRACVVRRSARESACHATQFFAPRGQDRDVESAAV
ncbi:hypothetical protein FJ423_31325 [Mesorhizobium sp. B2-8-9]|nr:hypothetical protein FJ423_31325 [Mesorhizobium sp. B2-8-9]